MGPITKQLYNQIRGWRIYSVIMPAVFTAWAALMWLYHGYDYQIVFYTGLIILGITCISWWHWSMSAMIVMLAIMKDTDDHFTIVADQLEKLRIQTGGKPNLKIVTNSIDNPK